MLKAPYEISLSAAGTGNQPPPILVAGYFNFSLSGSWVATVALQRSFDAGATWRTVESYTSNTEATGYEPEGADYRIICTAYTGGIIKGRIGV